MGAVLEKCLLFPAPPAMEKRGDACSPNIIWDMQTAGTPGGGTCRPFLWLQSPLALETVIYCHASAEDLGLVEPWLQNLSAHLGINILAFEYPGYGLLQDPSIMGHLGSTTAIMQWIDDAAVHAFQLVTNTFGICSSKVFIYGRSLGSGPALRLAQFVRRLLGLELGGVVLQSPFVSMRKVVGDVAGAAGRLLISADYDNLQAVRDLCSLDAAGAGAPSCPPLLVLHDELDQGVAPYHGRLLRSEALRCGHRCMEVVFPREATNEDWDLDCDITQHISDFIFKHMLHNPTCAKQPVQEELSSEPFSLDSRGSSCGEIAPSRYTDVLEHEFTFGDEVQCCAL